MKCGRTWLSVMIARALQLHFNTSEMDIKNLGRSSKYPGFCGLAFSHDDGPHWKRPEELEKSKARFRFKKVIFIVRDPRDVLVSMYFEKSKRLASYLEGERKEYPQLAERIVPYELGISSFVREPVGGIDTIIEFFNIWEKSKDIPDGFLLVHYEEMHENAEKVLRQVLDFIGLSAVGDEVIRQAVEFATFKSMQAMEKDNKLNTIKLSPVNLSDPDSFKTRKGKIGGFVEYLSREEIDYLNSRIKERLSPYFGYRVG